MIDPVAVTMAVVSHHSAGALPLVVGAGALTSVGPCAAPRYAALAALLASGSGRGRTLAVFVTGVVVGYAALGYAAGLLGALAAHAAFAEVGLAAAFAVGGARTLWQTSHRHRAAAPVRPTAAFALGAASAAVISPCCTPVLAAVAGLAATGADPFAGAAALAAFALGHCCALVLVGAGGAFAAGLTDRWTATGAPRTVAGALMLGLAGWYGALA